MKERPTSNSAVAANAGAFRQEILDTLALLLQRTSLDELRIAQILKAATVSRGTFYFYYASKEDAFSALLDQVYARVVPAFEALFVAPSPGALRDGVTAWLEFPPVDAAILRSAVEEWPRHAGIREIHLAAQRRMASAVTRALDASRTRAPIGLPSATLGSALVWTLERAWYEAVTASDSPAGVGEVNRALATTIESAVLGSPG